MGRYGSATALKVIIQQTVGNTMDVLQLLLDLGFDLSEPDVNGNNALYYACCDTPSRKVIQWLL